MRSEPNHHYNIAIIGLGPVGLMAMHLLASRGWRVLGIEQYTERLAFPRAIALDSEILRIFQSIGLAEELMAQMRPSNGLQLLNSQGQTLLKVGIASQNGYHESWMFDQPNMEALLEKHLHQYPTASLWKGHELTELTQTEDGVWLTINNMSQSKTQTVSASYAIACDGANSTVRHLLGIKQKQWPYQGHQLKIDAELPPDSPDLNFPDFVQKHCSTDFPWIRMKGYGQHLRCEFPLKKKELPKRPELYAQDMLTQAGMNPSHWHIRHVSLYQYASCWAKQWRKGRVFLAGDAAHLTPPYIGQGLCAGFRDTVNLAWKIDQALKYPQENHEKLLNTYQSERLPHFKFALTIAIGVGLLFKTPAHYLLQWLRYVPIVNKLLQNLEVAPPKMGKGHWGKGRGVRALFPQTRLHLPDGTQVWSDDFLGKDWAWVTLVASPSKPTAQCQQRGLQPQYISPSADASQVLQRWFKKHKATCALIRPDGFVYETWEG